jgi:Tfp pilus assembly protein PilF
LIQAASDRHLWAHTYEGNLGDVLGLQNLVAADIADQIRIKLTPQERAGLKSTRIVKPAAYEAYFKGRFYWDSRNTEGITRALDYFGEAIRDDPSFALPYAGLARVYSGMPGYLAIPPRVSYEKAKVAAAKALDLDSALAEARVALASVALTNDYDWSTSEQELRHAIELNPGLADAHHLRAMNLMSLAKWPEAVAEIEHARQLDPMSVIVNANFGFIYFHARRFDDAIAAERKALELDSNCAVAYEYLGLAYLGKKMYTEAVTNLRRAVDLSGEASQYASELSFAYAASGNRVEAQRILGRLQTRSRREYVPSICLAFAYTGLGDKARALFYLQKAYEERCDLIPDINAHPLLDSLHSDARF